MILRSGYILFYFFYSASAFAVGRYVTLEFTDFPKKYDRMEAQACGFDSQNRIILAIKLNYWNNLPNQTFSNDLMICRFLPSLEKDLSFGKNGYVIFDQDSNRVSKLNSPTAILIDDEDMYYISGISSYNEESGLSDFTLWKCTPNGSFDSLFGAKRICGIPITKTSGMVNYLPSLLGSNAHSTKIIDSPLCAAMDAKGCIWLGGGAAKKDFLFDMTYCQITSQGVIKLFKSFDYQNFDNRLYKSPSSHKKFDCANGCIIDSQKNIVFVGSIARSTPKNALALWKIKSTGQFDTIFGPYQNGLVTFGLDLEDSFEGKKIQQDTQNRYVVMGVKGLNALCLWRFLTDGTVDDSFGTHGMIVLPFNESILRIVGNDFKIDSLGRYWLAGYVQQKSDPKNHKAAIYRFLENGSYDDAFGTRGVMYYPLEFSLRTYAADDQVTELHVGDQQVIAIGFNSKEEENSNRYITQSFIWTIDLIENLDTKK